MTTRTFVPWVEPIAAQFREGRAEIVRTAQRFLPEFWGAMSPLPGWTYKDLLAHLAGDTGKNVQKVLRAVISEQPVDPALFAEVDAKNARDVQGRRERSVEDLIAEIESDREALLDLLSQLREEDEHRRQEEFPMSLGEALSTFPGHDRTHLEQLRTGLDNIML